MILQEQVSRYANEHVLVLGGRRDEIRQVAGTVRESLCCRSIALNVTFKLCFNKAHTMLECPGLEPFVRSSWNITLNINVTFQQCIALL